MCVLQNNWKNEKRWARARVAFTKNVTIISGGNPQRFLMVRFLTNFFSVCFFVAFFAAHAFIIFLRRVALCRRRASAGSRILHCASAASRSAC